MHNQCQTSVVVLFKSWNFRQALRAEVSSCFSITEVQINTLLHRCVRWIDICSNPHLRSTISTNTSTILSEKDVVFSSFRDSVSRPRSTVVKLLCQRLLLHLQHNRYILMRFCRFIVGTLLVRPRRLTSRIFKPYPPKTF